MTNDEARPLRRAFGLWNAADRSGSQAERKHSELEDLLRQAYYDRMLGGGQQSSDGPTPRRPLPDFGDLFGS
jgi:hypothetical protein